MTVYVIGQLEFTDENRYRAYQAAFEGAFAKSGGRLLAADERPVLMEGDWIGDKVVLMEFPHERAAAAFMNSPEYRQISKDRKAGADTVGLMVRGVATA
ncbi:MAG: DUF1330 domain-containing protein [Pseudomonadota bacterium]